MHKIICVNNSIYYFARIINEREEEFMKKKFLAIIIVFIAIVFCGNAAKAYDLIDLEKAGGGYVTHRGTDIRVRIPDAYEIPDRDFRGVWISTMTSDIDRFRSVEQYKEEINKVFAIMEHYNLNAMMFHVRIYNDALYDSALNKRSTYYSAVNFSEWDPLAWIIEECHKRGIEFHAWMNPYRVKSSGAPDDLAAYAATEPASNIASNPEYLLHTAGSSGSKGIILNPGEPAVRDFIVETCLELAEKYDVDAIHFDDYFYASGVDDSATRAKYNTQGLSVENFRRLQVDLFIEQLSAALRDFNLQTGRLVQLGISPTGIYRNGSYTDNYVYDDNGNLISPSGSNTSGFAHYGDYLYCDTKKWIDNEWIDYILPQSYWGFEHKVAGYADVMDWWDKVVEYKNVNLYSGMGAYMIGSAGDWKNHPLEALNQLKYGVKLKNVKGHCIYSFKHLRYAYEETGAADYAANFRNVKEEAWKYKAIMPEIRTYNRVKLPRLKQLQISVSDDEKVLTFENNPYAKSYVIYRSKTPITYAPEEIYDIIGAEKSAATVTYVDDSPGSYYYGVKVMSNTNALSEGAEVIGVEHFTVIFKNENNSVIDVKTVKPGESVTPPAIIKEGYDLVGWSEDLSSVNSDLVVYPIFAIKRLTVTFIVDEEIYEVLSVDYGGSVTPPDIPAKTGYDQTPPFWNHDDFSEIKEDLEVHAVYTANVYTVTFVGFDNEVLKTETVEHASAATPPEAPEVEGYVFKGWDASFTDVTSDLTVTARYEKQNAFFSCANTIYLNAYGLLGAALFIFLRRVRRKNQQF